MASSFDPARLKKELKPFRLHFFPRLRSTNDHAAILRKRGDLFAPAIVLTPNQIAGRGRGRNTWWSTQSALTVTFAMQFDKDRDPHTNLSIEGLPYRNASDEHSGEFPIRLKSPYNECDHKLQLSGHIH